VFSRLGTVRLVSRHLLAFPVAALLAAGISACGSGGGGDLLPGTTASQINANLDQVQRLVGEEQCEAATDAAAQVTAEVDELGGVDAKLKQLLVEGAEHLEAVVLTCEETAEPLETTEIEEPEIEEEEKPEKHEKPEKTKPKETGPPAEPPEPPGHEGGKGEGEGPTEEPGGGSSSGGVGPGQEVEGE
jgi:septal ring-binding cell division protein DamX